MADPYPISLDGPLAVLVALGVLFLAVMLIGGVVSWLRGK